MIDPKLTLLALEQQLQHKLTKIHADFAVTANADSNERAVERENDEVLDQLEKQLSLQLQQVHTALQAIADGSYGRCSSCGHAISTERLTVLPYTLHCQQCA
jgi:RNA polymerase-binding transcription factor DksA